jgi:hypothetical protein
VPLAHDIYQSVEALSALRTRRDRPLMPRSSARLDVSVLEGILNGGA